MKINGLAAIVTGGASGLGAGTDKRTADAGAEVTIFLDGATIRLDAAIRKASK